MPASGLTTLQRRVVTTLAGLQPSWALTGGAALVGVHGIRRTTRDIDLFFHGQAHLGRAPEQAIERLTANGLDVVSLEATDAFKRFRVSDGSEIVVLDLVAEPVSPVEPPSTHDWDGTPVQVDTPHEILVNKLCDLVHRSELRDLSDVHDLLAAGGDLEWALADAPRKEAGFSPLTLAWVVRELPLDAMAEMSDVEPGAREHLATFRESLVSRLTTLARPAD